MKTLFVAASLLSAAISTTEAQIQSFIFAGDTNGIYNGRYLETGPALYCSDTFSGPGGVIRVGEIGYPYIYCDLASFVWTNSVVNTPGEILTNVAPGQPVTITFLLVNTNVPWTTLTTNYWSAPGDYVTISASGRNLSAATNSNALILTLDGHRIFTGPWTAGAGNQWTVYGRVQWDGSNLLSSGTFTSGDTNTPSAADTEIISTASIGTNAWAWQVWGQTNGLTFDAATITASRATTSDAPQHLFGTALSTGASIPALATVSNLAVAVTGNLNTVSNNYVVTSNSLASGDYSFAGMPQDADGDWRWGTNGMNLAYVTPANGFTYYGIGDNGIDDGSNPSLGVDGFVFENANGGNPVDFAWATLDDDGGSWLTDTRFETRGGYVLTGGSKELQFGWSSIYIGGFGYQPNLLLGDTFSTCTTGFSIGEGVSPNPGGPPVNGLYVAGACSLDAGLISSDGSGNLTAQTFTPVSDRALKDNILPIPSGRSLQMALALTNYQWNFKARTNLIQSISRQTNSVGTNLPIKTSPVLVTNQTPKIFAASGKQYGPMAQDWHAVTGLDDGRHISTTAMQGLLLGAIQDLNREITSQSQPSPGGAVYPSVPWNLAAITNAMPNFGVWTGNSNGCCLVTLSLSNGVVRYLQALH